MTAMAETRYAYCLSCGEDSEADAQTGRCLRCGKLAVAANTQAAEDERRHLTHRSPSAAYREPFRAAAPQAAVVAPAVGEATAGVPAHPPATRFELPSTRPTRSWLKTTRALQARLIAQAEAVEKKGRAAAAAAAAKEATYKAESARLRQSVSVLTQLLEQIGIVDAGPEPRARPVKATPPRPAGTRWSGKSSVQVDACLDCGTSERPHLAMGRCARCDSIMRQSRRRQAAS